MLASDAYIDIRHRTERGTRPNQQHPRTSLTPVFLTGTRLARLNRSGDHENKKLDRQGKATTMRNPWHDILDID
jgi:hypothetical protein